MATVREIGELLGSDEGARLMAEFERVAFPPAYPDPTDLSTIIERVKVLAGPEWEVPLTAMAVDAAARRGVVSRRMAEAYVVQVEDFTLMHGAGDGYSNYLRTISRLASQRIMISRDLIGFVRHALGDHPRREDIERACADGEAQLDAALTLPAFLGQPTLLKLEPDRRLSRLAGFAEGREIEIPW